MRERSEIDIAHRVASVFRDKIYIKRLNESQQRWIDKSAEEITESILEFLSQFNSEKQLIKAQ